jgi:hypothetical protein
MASTSEVNLWAEVTLRSTGLLLEDIYDRAPDWEQRPEDERADFWLEWEAIVGRLEGVIQDDRGGTLTADQQQRLRELARRLLDARDVILRIGLIFPDLGHTLDDVPLTSDQRVDIWLRSLRYWMGLLRNFSDLQGSPFLDERERQAFPLEWDNALDRLVALDDFDRQGKLGKDARAELRMVADELHALLPTMQRLKLRQPDPEALARARAVEVA